jgi:hypothetical protein
VSDIKCDTSPSDRTQFELFRALFSGFKWRISTSPCWPFGGPNVENFLRLFLQKVYIDHKLNICGRTIWSETCILYHCMICNFVILTCGICVRKGVNEKGVCPSISAFPCHYSANTPCSYCVHSPLVLYTRRIWQRRYTHTHTPSLFLCLPLLHHLKAPDLTWLPIASDEIKMNCECCKSS